MTSQQFERDSLKLRYPVYPWFAVWVRARHEKSVARALTGKGYSPFLPLYASTRRSAGTAPSMLPLFPGYVFCRFDPEHSLTILQVSGVASIVSAGNELLPIEEQEMTSLQLIVDSGSIAQPWPYLAAGQRVRIDKGPLRGIEGVFVHESDYSGLVVSITLLQRSLRLEVSRDMVTPVYDASAGPHLNYDIQFLAPYSAT